MAKNREDARLSLTRNINELLERKEENKGELKEAEVASECHDEYMASMNCSFPKALAYGVKLKKEVELCKMALKITKFSIIIGISLRDKKGTYPQLKSKYSETLEDYMTLIDTSAELCNEAESMKQQYEIWELIYSVLK